MAIIENLTANVTAFHNNCLLHCIGHSLLEELAHSDEQSLSHSLHPWQLLGQAFNDYYATALNLLEFKQLFHDKFSHPIDREYILGPVLRQCLVAVTRSQPIYQESNEFFSILIDYLLTDGQAKDKNIVVSNQTFFEALNQQFKDNGQARTQEEIEIFLTSNVQAIQNYWLTKGRDNYTHALADATELSVSEGAILARQLGIQLSDYSYQNLQQDVGTEADYTACKVSNQKGHWVYQAASAILAKQHNSFYNGHGIGLEPYALDKISALGKAILPYNTDGASLLATVKERVQKEVAALKIPTPTLAIAPLVANASKAPPAKQHLFPTPKTNLPPVFVKHEQPSLPSKHLRAVNQSLDTLLQGRGLQIERKSYLDTEVVTYTQTKSQNKDKAVLEVNNDSLVCKEPNAFAKDILVEHIVQLVIRGNIPITVTGGPANYSDELKQAANARIAKLPAGQQPSAQQAVFNEGIAPIATIPSNFTTR